MNDHLTSARVVLIDGPVALYIKDAPGITILQSLARVAKLASVAAQQLDIEKNHAAPNSVHPLRPSPRQDHDSGGGARKE